MPCGPIAEVRNRALRCLVAGAQQRAHVTRVPGERQQSALLIQQHFKCRAVEPFITHECQQNTRIDRSAAGAHDETIKWRKPHGGCDAPPVSNSRDTRTIAEMEDKQSRRHGLCGNRWKHFDDVLIVETVEPVPPIPFVVELLR